MLSKKLEKTNISKANESASFWKFALIKFKKHKMAMGSLYLLVLIILLSVFVPMVSIYEYDYVDLNINFPSPPGVGYHIFGTDTNGRDLMVRLFMGVRISILIGVLASIVSLIIGVIWGSVAGYFGGKIDLLMMRIVDVLYAVPFMFIIILLVVVFGRNIYLIFVSIGAVSWLTMARIVRGQTMSIKNREFIEAAKSYSLPSSRIIGRHIIPNLLGTVIVYLTLTIPNVILVESFISFLGLGVQEPMTSLGVLIAEGSRAIENYVWLFIFPCIFLSLILFCLNFIGDGLRDALDQNNK